MASGRSYTWFTADYWDEVSNTLASCTTSVYARRGEETYLRNDSSFVAGYAWKIHHLMNDIAHGKTVNEIDTLLDHDRKAYTYGYNMYSSLIMTKIVGPVQNSNAWVMV
jgi:hypothetical protein